jgi:hypothetical protein
VVTPGIKVRVHAACLLLASALLGGCSLEPRPDFSGTWRLDPDRSRYGRVEKPSWGRVTIEHEDPAFRVRIEFGAAGGRTAVRTMDLRSDGAPTPIRLRMPEGREVEALAETSWQRGQLAVVYSLSHSGHIDRFEETWTLARNGRELTHRRDMELPDRAGRKVAHRVEELYRR